MMTENTHTFQLETLSDVMHAAKVVARRYRQLTGRALGITGEVGEVTAVELLGLDITQHQQTGYDAVRIEDGKETKIQIKSRCIIDPSIPGQRVGAINLDKEWECVVLVILDADFEPVEIYEADRPAVEEALTRPGSKARNIRGQLSYGKFKSIGRLVWGK